MTRLAQIHLGFFSGWNKLQRHTPAWQLIKTVKKTKSKQTTLSSPNQHCYGCNSPDVYAILSTKECSCSILILLRNLYQFISFLYQCKLSFQWKCLTVQLYHKPLLGYGQNRNLWMTKKAYISADVLPWSCTAAIFASSLTTFANKKEILCVLWITIKKIYSKLLCCICVLLFLCQQYRSSL